MSAHTPGPWRVGEYDDYLGYDCMTGGVRAGPVVLDGGSYGQKSCLPIEPAQLDRLMADARLIAAAPELLEALRLSLAWLPAAADHPSATVAVYEAQEAARAAIAKATGEQ